METTGRVLQTSRGLDLEIVRSLALSITEAWEYITESEYTERWFGPWEGDDRVGGSIRVRLRFEEEEPAIRVRILGCDAPGRLELESADEYGSWHLELTLEEDGADDTLLRFVHHLDGDANVGDIGPGWEFYLDLLVAATEDTEQPSFDQYYPALREAYVAMLP